MLEWVARETKQFVASMSREKRKLYGQFFTEIATARYMASLFSIETLPHTISVLDPGAGSGILSVALMEKLQENPCVKLVNLYCYESDEAILALLHSNLKIAADAQPYEVKIHIIPKNYITSQHELEGDLSAAPQLFDVVIANPPYKKVARDAPEALSMPHVCHGAPNLYFLFAAQSIANLKPGAEMVYIMPRSWTSGAYFSAFRKFLLKNTAIEHIHLFESRSEVFSSDGVLQETIIIKIRRTEKRSNKICISSCIGAHDFKNLRTYNAPYSSVVSGNENFIFLITSDEEAALIRRVRNCRHTLAEYGLAMHTGRTVEYREKHFIVASMTKDAVPLFGPQHIRNGKFCFELHAVNAYVSKKAASLCQANGVCVFVKRFTSKEDNRRIQSAVYLPSMMPESSHFSTQNKLNYIEIQTEDAEVVAYGLFVLFNSNLYDRYYRILNGSTQVNSTEVNHMPVPCLQDIKKMGAEFLRVMDYSASACDKIINILYE